MVTARKLVSSATRARCSSFHGTKPSELGIRTLLTDGARSALRADVGRPTPPTYGE